MLCLLALLLATGALDRARADLAAGKLDRLVFALAPGEELAPAETKEAAGLLAQGAQRASSRGDRPLALQLAQLAVRRDPGEARALELLCQFALGDKEYGQARRYSVAWSHAHPGDAAAAAMAARLEAEESRWRPIKIVELKPRSPRAQQAAPATGARADEPQAPGSAEARSAHFRIVFARGSRDWAERGQYQVNALEHLEQAWAEARGQLGDGLAGPFEVVLYTREEFSQSFGAALAGHVLGFYAGKIRLNRSESLDGSFHAVALHELVHAALDALAQGRGGQIATWLNEGTARYVERAALTGTFLSPRELRLVATYGAKLPLSSLAHISFTQLGGSAELGYAKSAAAVAALSRDSGLNGVTRVVRSIGQGSSFESAFASVFGKARLASLDQDAEGLARQSAGR